MLLIPFVFALVFSPSLSASAQKRKQERMDFKETTLENGLRVIMIEDRSAPVIAIAVTYNVGSRDERKGRTGFAHLFEHMMFQGSENIGKGEQYRLVFSNGGTMNGSTSADGTQYYNALPSNQLDLALFLEADRMRSLAITKENLDNQRNAVQEERRIRLDNKAYGKTGEILGEMIYDNFAYQHSTLGSMEDLNAASVEDVAAFFKIYYAPNNAVLTLAGDFETADALERIRKNFGNIPRQSAPPVVDMTEPEQKGERRASIDDPLARLAHIDIAFKAVAGNTPEFYAMQILSSVLQDGQSSRLYQKLVKEKGLATDVFGYMDERRGIGAFYIQATVASGKNAADAEASIYEEIEKLRTAPIAERELQKAKNFIRRNFITDLQGALNLAVLAGDYALFYNDPGLINKRLDKVDAVTVAEVQKVADKFLRETNRVVVVTTPKVADKTTGDAKN
jgi:predicted Zn-dependent peptidase